MGVGGYDVHSNTFSFPSGSRVVIVGFSPSLHWHRMHGRELRRIHIYTADSKLTAEMKSYKLPGYLLKRVLSIDRESLCQAPFAGR